jgi:cation transport regulator ChaC
MVLHFAYGSNMSRAGMRARCPGAEALGPAALDGWRFLINADGYASIAAAPGGRVHGVLWRLTARDLGALNAYESVHSGLYLRRTLPVRWGTMRRRALVFIARRGEPGRPRPGYLAGIIEAAREWHLPPDYIWTLGRWSASGWRGARAVETGEIAR